MRVSLPFAILGFLAACGHTDNKLSSAQSALMEEVMAYQNCMRVNNYVESACAAERAGYEKDLATFKTTYGK
jgi:hypothetical protein